MLVTQNLWSCKTSQLEIFRMKAEYNIKTNVILQPYKDSEAPTS